MQSVLNFRRGYRVRVHSTAESLTLFRALAPRHSTPAFQLAFAEAFPSCLFSWTYRLGLARVDDSPVFVVVVVVECYAPRACGFLVEINKLQAEAVQLFLLIPLAPVGQNYIATIERIASMIAAACCFQQVS